MRNRVPFNLELAGESATLYVHGRLDQQGCATLVDVCASLPLTVRTLRLDLRAVGAMTAEVTSTVRLVLQQWRAERQGEFRLATAHLTAVCRTLPATPLCESMPAGYARHPMALAPL